jgi:hypothetical protein
LRLIGAQSARCFRLELSLAFLERAQPMNDKDSKLLLEELQAIKKLLILQLLGAGFKQKQIASMLGIHEATMSRLIPSGATAKTARQSDSRKAILDGGQP